MQPVRASSAYTRPPWLPTNTRPPATVGCDQIAGSYRLNADRLEFVSETATVMPCPAPLDEWEKQLGRVLTAAVLLTAALAGCTQDDPPSPASPAASTDPAEFFAVLSEGFFETPDIIAAEYPAIYGLLCRYYVQDPLARLTKAASASRTAAS